MKTSWQTAVPNGLGNLEQSQIEVLDPAEERELLRGLADCRLKLAEALVRIEGPCVTSGADDPHAFAEQLASLPTRNGPSEARLGAIARRYAELRSRLALANLRLVAHVARRYRDRGIAYTDLLQEGFCGLLEAIDRFDLSRETKLATYATWWIRQSMQHAVASGAYPVRLTPRHLRQLAQNQAELGQHEDEIGATTVLQSRPGSEVPAASVEIIRRIHTATRPTVSLDQTIGRESQFRLLQTMSDSAGDAAHRVDRDEILEKLMKSLRPREQEVLALRFGLRGRSRHSLSKVGKVLNVSKERVRQIQDRALEKLRAAAHEHNLDDLLSLDP
jgi:RNA polymerase primary sigma factor